MIGITILMFFVMGTPLVAFAEGETIRGVGRIQGDVGPTRFKYGEGPDHQVG